jgi:hypothetical protein
LVINYTFLFSNRVPPNQSLAEQSLALMNNDHGRAENDRIGQSANMVREFGVPAELTIPLSGGASWSNPTNRLELACVPAGRILIKINSIKLVKD